MASSLAQSTPSVADLLSATLSVDGPQRHAAELALARLSTAPEHAAELLRLAATSSGENTPSSVAGGAAGSSGGHASSSASVGSVVAMAASIRLKNAARAARRPTFFAATVPAPAAPATSEHGLAGNESGGAAPGTSSSPTTQRAVVQVAPLTPEARALIRNDLLPALAVDPPQPVRTALAETLRWMVLLDFPARWSGLVPQIHEFLATGDVKRILAALFALHKIAKCYEFKSADPSRLDADDPNDAGIANPREPLDRVCASTFPMLLDLFVRLGGADVPNAKLCRKMIMKIFWCSMQFMIPAHLAETGVFNAWMEAMLSVFETPVPVAPGTPDEDLALMYDFKVKKWIGKVILRMLKRYGHPRQLPIEEHSSRAVANVFHNMYAAKATASMLHVLAWPTAGQALSGRVANIAIDYLQEAVETASLWAVMLPHVDLLLSRIIFPYLCFSDDDAELWELDPGEYVRKQTDIAEDYTSPRMAAMNLLSTLGELRPKNTVLPFMTHLVATVLDPYRASQRGSQERSHLARQKVGALQALNACKLRLRSKVDLETTFLSVLEVHAVPELQSEFGFLRAMACRLLGDVASMGWDRFSERLGEASLRGAVTALEDPELPVRATAGAALHYLMDAQAAQPLIAPFAPQLLERLLLLMDQMSEGFATLLPTLDKLVDCYPDELMPLAVPLMRRLVAAFQHAAAEARAAGDDEDGDDDLVYQAAQMPKLISSVLTTAGEWEKPSQEDRIKLFGVLEEELKPMLGTMFNENSQIFAEETLDVLHTLLIQAGELRNATSPFLLSLVPELVKSFESEGGEYMASDIVGPLEAYLAYDLDGLLAMNGAVLAIMSIVQRLWGEHYEDGEAVYGAKIADALILGLAQHPSRGTELCNSVVATLARDAAKRCSRTTDEEEDLRVRVFGTVMLAIYYDAHTVVTELGGGAQVMQLTLAVLADLESFRRVHDKKAVMLGFSAMLRARELGIDSSCPELVRGVIGLQNRIDAQRSGDEEKNKKMNMLANWAKMGGLAGDGSIGDALTAEDDSELDDHEDAASKLPDARDHTMLNELEKLSAETGMPIEELEQMNQAGRVGLSSGFFDFEELNDDDDEGDNRTNRLDSIDEIAFFIDSIKEAVNMPWWGAVGPAERNAIEQFAQRVQR